MTNIQQTMMKQETRFLYYQLFCHYYRGDFQTFTLLDWMKVVQFLREYQSTYLIDEAVQALKMLEKVNEIDIQTFEYDYNRLFVGPNKLLASPYESSYRNFEGNLFQQETLKVRNFYHYAGLQVEDEGQIPDDHIQFELEFIVHILGDPKIQERDSIYKMFLEKHLLQWVFLHCEHVQRNSQNAITYAMALLLKEFLQLEKMTLQGGDQDDK